MNISDGQLKTITVAATAGNATSDKSPGLYKKWLVLYGQITLVTDATVADRNVYMKVVDSAGNLITNLQYAAACAASSTKTYCLAPINGVITSGTGGNGLSETPNGVWIDSTDKLRTSVSSGVAGDSFSGYLKVVELPA